MAKKNVRVIVKLACEKCNRRNYMATKNKRTHPERLAYKKYCPYDREHTVHKETR